MRYMTTMTNTATTKMTNAHQTSMIKQTASRIRKALRTNRTENSIMRLIKLLGW